MQSDESLIETCSKGFERAQEDHQEGNQGDQTGQRMTLEHNRLIGLEL